MGARAVLLDVDGTLVDSNEAHARAWADALSEDGQPVPLAAIRPLIGMGGDKLVDVLAGLHADHPRARALRDRRKQVFAERYLPGVRPFPGARDLVARMARAGLRRVAATSASREDLERLLELAGVADLIDDATTADDVQVSKPQPDLVLAAIDKAGCAPDEAVLVGDTPWDVAAALRAGASAVALRTGCWADADLEGAAAIYDDPADLLRRWAASPFAAGAVRAGP